MENISVSALLPEPVVRFVNFDPKKMDQFISPGIVSKISNYISIYTLLAIFVGICLLQSVYDILLHPLRKVPGPFLSRFSQSWRNIRYFRGTWHSDIAQLHRDYGTVVRIAPDEVSFVDPPALKSLYGLGKKQGPKSNWYHSWYVPNMTVSFFAATDANLHKHLRSRVSAAYSMSSILTMEPFIQEVADEGWGRFREFARLGKQVPMHQWASYFAFDVVGQLALGGKIGFIEQGKDVDGIIQSIHDGFYLMANMGNVPLQMFWFNNFLAQWMVKKFGGKRLNSFSVFLDWLDSRVSERMEKGLGDRRRDMLQHFIDAKDMDKQPVKKGDVMIEGVNILGAGADTTSIAILAVLGALLTHPMEFKKVQEEVDRAYKDLGLEDNGGEICFKDTEKLQYLAAVIKESMRLHPSITYQLPRVVPAPGIQISGHFVKPGTIASVSAISINRSKEIFGPNADEWRPERWIPTTKEEAENITATNGLLMTFGMGSRSCVGKNIALVEVHKYIAQFSRHFDAELVNKELPWVTKSQWFSIQKDFWVTIKERKPQAN